MVKSLKAIYLLFVVFVLIAFTSCRPASHKLSKAKQTNNLISKSQSSKEIKAVLMAQQWDWNNGDIPAFMKGYWKSDELIFVGGSGINKGWDTTLKNYLNAYPDVQTMGQLEFEVLALDSLSNELYRMVGNYALQREADRPKGIFTLIWKRINGHWKIISDHTSG